MEVVGGSRRGRAFSFLVTAGGGGALLFAMGVGAWRAVPFRCVPVAMLPLTTNTDAAIATLDEIKSLAPAQFNRGHTHTYLGPLWASRMLDPDWHDIWAAQHPDAAPKRPEFPNNLLRSCTGDDVLNPNPANDLRTFHPDNAERLAESFATIARGLVSVQRMD